MTAALKLCALALIVTALIAVQKQLCANFTFSLRAAGFIAAAAVLLIMAAPAADYIKTLFSNAGMSHYAEAVMKGIGVAFLSCGAASVCRDSGEGTLAACVELAGKVEIFLLCIPLINEIISAASALLGKL